MIGIDILCGAAPLTPAKAKAARVAASRAALQKAIKRASASIAAARKKVSALPPVPHKAAPAAAHHAAPAARAPRAPVKAAAHAPALRAAGKPGAAARHVIGADDLTQLQQALNDAQSTYDGIKAEVDALSSQSGFGGSSYKAGVLSDAAQALAQAAKDYVAADQASRQLATDQAAAGGGGYAPSGGGTPMDSGSPSGGGGYGGDGDSGASDLEAQAAEESGLADADDDSGGGGGDDGAADDSGSDDGYQGDTDEAGNAVEGMIGLDAIVAPTPIGIVVNHHEPLGFAADVTAITIAVVLAEIVIMKVLNHWRWLK